MKLNLHLPGQVEGWPYLLTVLHFLFRFLLPPPQFFEHSPHGPQGPHCVSGGQSSNWQNKTIVDGPGHGLSSSRLRFLAFLTDFGTWQALDLDLVPPPEICLIVRKVFHWSVFSIILCIINVTILNHKVANINNTDNSLPVLLSSWNYGDKYAKY